MIVTVASEVTGVLDTIKEMCPLLMRDREQASKWQEKGLCE